ncbi:hypothetical protein cypCar_00020108 [Cyprinus carpio]|nr:hypothetical protein cypCar_00020108 [Cyprinus carpio]
MEAKKEEKERDKVALRIRPLSDAELEEGATIIAHKVDDQVSTGGLDTTPSTKKEKTCKEEQTSEFPLKDLGG